MAWSDALFVQVNGIDGPENGDEDWVDDVHDGFLFNNSEVVLVVVFQDEGFHNQGHEGSGEEQTQAVLQAEGELELVSSAVPFQVSEIMEKVGNHNFVEQNHEENHQEHDNQSLHFVLLIMGLLELVHVGFDHHWLLFGDESEHHSQDYQHQNTEEPSEGQQRCSFGSAQSDVLPNELFGFGSFAEFDILPSRWLEPLFLIFVQHIWFIVFSIHDDDASLSLHSVLVV